MLIYMTMNQNKNIKIFKAATNVSLIDVGSALHYYQKKENEIVYKGSLVLTINEYGRSKVQLQAFLPKSTAKMIFELIKNNGFHQLFPQGYRKYGGSAKTMKARVLTIQYEPDKMRYKFQIEEGQGQIIKNGAMKMVQRDKVVQTYVSLFDTLEMAHEVLDFIRHQELLSLMNGNGEPLYSYSAWGSQQPMNHQGYEQGYNQFPQQFNQHG